MGRRNTARVMVWREQINPHAPKVRTVPDPLHATMFPDCADVRADARLGQCSGVTPERARARFRKVMITYTFAGLPVTNYRTAYDWYARLLGRGADMFPHDTEAVWRLTPNGAIYVVQDPDRAGSGLMTAAVDDLGAFEDHLRETGLAFEEQVSEHSPRRLVVRDADGNTLAFFTDLARAGT